MDAFQGDLQLSAQLVSFLTPTLPFLGVLGLKALEKTGEKLSDGSIELGKTIWEKLHPKASDTAIAAAKTLAEIPPGAEVSPGEKKKVARAQRNLEEELHDILSSDPDFAQELRLLLAKSDKLPKEKNSITVNVQGENNVGIANLTGDFNYKSGKSK